MFHHRSKEFDPRISAIASHLRAIEKELGGIGMSASRRASAAGSQVADLIGPILNEISDYFGRGRRAAVDQGLSFGNEAINVGATAGIDALERVATQAKNRPVATLAVAVGVGLLIGFAISRG